MRIDSEKLPQHLAQGVQPLYTVVGSEPLLALEAIDRLQAAARGHGYTEREVLSAESGFDWSSLRLAQRNLSLFAPRKLLELRIPSGKPGLEGARELEALCRGLTTDLVVVIALPKLERATQSAKWLIALEQAGVMVVANPVERARLPAWVGERLALQGQRAEPAVLQFVADRVEGNLVAAFQEIHKLALLFPPGALELNSVQGAVTNVARYDVFKLSESLLNGDRARLARSLLGLRDEGEAAPLVLWAITEEIRALIKVKRALARGATSASAPGERPWGRRQEILERVCRVVPLESLHTALRCAARIDRMAKGLERGDVWDELLQLGLAVVPAGTAPVLSPARRIH